MFNAIILLLSHVIISLFIKALYKKQKHKGSLSQMPSFRLAVYNLSIIYDPAVTKRFTNTSLSYKASVYLALTSFATPARNPIRILIAIAFNLLSY